MKTLTVTALLLTLILYCSACVPSVGQPFPVDKVRQIEIGMTTKANIQQMFGEPWRTGVEDGFKTWTYGEYTVNQSRDLVIRFDDKERVKSYSFSSSFPEDKDL